MSEETTSGSASDIQAVTRAAQILQLFGPNRPQLTAAEAAELLGMNRSTVYRYCNSLVAAGLLERGHAIGSFAPGGLLLQLGTFALSQRKVLDLAPALMRDLSSSAHMTAVLSLWGSGGPVVSRVEEDTSRNVVVSVRVGSQLPLTSAQAKVFLAFTSDQLRTERMLSALPPEQQEALRAEIELTRETGVATSPDLGGVNAVSAPIFDEHGICASLALVATNHVLGLDRDSQAAWDVATAAAELSAALGGGTRRNTTTARSAAIPTARSN
jgi:DNA-binding IclR family transcriptional regulator